MAIEIKSSLINSPEFARLKQTLIKASEEDGQEKFRVNVVEYINDSSSSNDDDFFYDMVEFVRFLTPSEGQGHVAYTMPNHMIYMNCPNDIIKGVRQWDFVYDHECLHQLWNTFAVEDKIKKSDIYFDHNILNIASDCVINDYLSYSRKKEMPSGLITPEYIKEHYGIDYDRKRDTQFSLYVKIVELMNNDKKTFDKMMDDPVIKKALDEIGDKKIKPGKVEKQQGGGGPQGPQEEHSLDYKRGWAEGIKDVVGKKVDPLTYKPREVKNDYDKGYNDVLKEIKNGLENGITLSDDNSGGNQQQSPQSDLADIPWDTPPSESNGGGKSKKDMNKDEAAEDAQKSADKAQESADKAQQSAENAADKASQSGSSEDKEAADRAKQAANDAKEAADKAKKAADKAKKAAEKGDTEGAQDAADEAEAAANEAEGAAKDAQNAGEGKSEKSSDPIDNMSAEEAVAEAQKYADEAKEYADKAKEGAGDDPEKQKKAADAKKFADKAQQAADEASKAANADNVDKARRAAKEAKNRKIQAESAEDAVNGNNEESNNFNSNGGGSSSHQRGESESSDTTTYHENLDDIKRAEETIKNAQNKISGVFGEFVTKCKSSAQLNESGLAIKGKQGAAGWNVQMNSAITSFVRKKIFQKKRELEQTYKRPNRRQGVLKPGSLILKGKRIKQDGITINLAFYIDRSGSMQNCIDDVFKAAYTICEAVKKDLKHEKIVNEVVFKMHAFDMRVHELAYGKKMSADGGTMEFDELFGYIEKNTNDYIINVIITDGDSTIREKVITDLLKKINNLVIFISNNQKPEVEKISKIGDNGVKLKYILADSRFTIE